MLTASANWAPEAPRLLCATLRAFPNDRKTVSGQDWRLRELENWFSGRSGPAALFAGRVLPFDEAAAMAWARLMVEGTTRGRLRSAIDMMIGAIAEANYCVIVTDNEKDFAGLTTVNPMRPAA